MTDADVASTEVLFLDIDRTLSPIADLTAWPEYSAVPSPFGDVFVASALAEALGSLPAHIVYVTDWDDPHIFDAVIGRTDTETGVRGPSDSWWKVDCIDRWLSAHRSVVRFVHADAHLNENRRATLARIAQRHGCEHLAVTPTDGLTPDHLDHIIGFLTGGEPPHMEAP
ncbi:hypothetical protein [Curtobacterium sp. MCBD17_040]|uniref:hypothetical protein n=1 Tax=Curtobacterium sp. MCBD17_040 TaxID=2175674 RepID=UPI0011B50649|nr:hypothetical protein [Curtobacterium sp. MCBD17_040]WIB65312.1 hypothetical protein DEI94_18065 [Curtobacterium sp. MCBD17_040]